MLIRCRLRAGDPGIVYLSGIPPAAVRRGGRIFGALHSAAPMHRSVLPIRYSVSRVRSACRPPARLPPRPQGGGEPGVPDCGPAPGIITGTGGSGGADRSLPPAFRRRNGRRPRRRSRRPGSGIFYFCSWFSKISFKVSVSRSAACASASGEGASPA